MHLLLVYDIPNDKTRGKVADICLDYGLDRVQYSAFMGELSRVHQEELMEKAHKHLGKQEGKIYLYPICEKDWQNKIQIDQEKDEEDE